MRTLLLLPLFALSASAQFSEERVLAISAQGQRRAARIVAAASTEQEAIAAGAWAIKTDPAALGIPAGISPVLEKSGCVRDTQFKGESICRLYYSRQGVGGVPIDWSGLELVVTCSGSANLGHMLTDT
jgi:hypothetical protein